MRYSRGHSNDERDQRRSSNQSGRDQGGRQRRSASSYPDQQSRPPRRTTLPFPEEERERRQGRGTRNRQTSRAPHGYDSMDEQRSRRTQRGEERSATRSRRHDQEQRPRKARGQQQFDPFEPQTSPRPQRQTDQRSPAGSRRRPQRHSDHMDDARAPMPARNPRAARLDDSPSNYARNSERYARQAPSRGAGRSQRPDAMGASSRAQGAMRASSYGRDRYVRQPNQGSSDFPEQQRSGRMRGARPLNMNHALIAGGIALVLLAILIIRFVVFSGTASDYNAVKAQIEQENAQTLELEVENNELQGEIDSMQGLIEQYNALKN